MLDMLVQPVVQSIAPGAVPSAPSSGECWVAGASAGGAWTGHDHALACWTGGGWRFVEAFEGLRVLNADDGLFWQYRGSAWEGGAERAVSLSIGGEIVVSGRQAAIPDPSGGSVVDSQSRGAVTLILAALRAHGLIAA